MALTANDYLVQVEIQTKSLVPANRLVNALAFTDTGGTSSFTDLCDAVEAGFQNFAVHYMSSKVIPSTLGAHLMKVYRLSEARPRQPVHTQTFTLSPPGDNPYPNEVALCSSISAEVGSGDNAARRRGRIYIGPLSVNSGESTTDGFCRPTADAQAKAIALMTSIQAAAYADGWTLAVWSRKDNALFPVVRGWCNNEFDTQRRRGPDATSRTSWNLSV